MEDVRAVECHFSRRIASRKLYRGSEVTYTFTATTVVVEKLMYAVQTRRIVPARRPTFEVNTKLSTGRYKTSCLRFKCFLMTIKYVLLVYSNSYFQSKFLVIKECYTQELGQVMSTCY